MFEKSRIIKFIGLVICSLSVNACTTPGQAYWDAKVKELCEMDGGITVFERVEISRKDHPDWEYATNGELIVPSERYCKNTCEYYISETQQSYLNKHPEVWRRISKLIRSSDKVVIAQSVNYARMGGDVIKIDHPSTYSCVQVGSFKNQSLSLAIMIKGE